MSADRILEGLNPQQVEAVTATRGPVCILAGAGSGKTTTVTRRIAYQIHTSAFSSSQILAVTFTDKASKEMGSRLATLGAGQVRAKTFHSEAKAQFHRFTNDQSEIIASKVLILKGMVAGLPRPHRFVSSREIAGEIEWAKNQRISPGRYLDALGDHKPPIPEELMAGLYAGYERRKQNSGRMDFEDLLERTIQVLSDNPAALQQLRQTYSAFTVDEYQDVNLLQQSLLDVWIGDRQDICVVGDDYQSIYSFTGATPRHLLEFPERHAGCKTVPLTLNYRSTPEILSAANRLAPRLGGSSKTLQPTVPSGPAPTFRAFSDGESETAWIVEKVNDLNRDGVRWEEMAILYRINARSDDFEEAFTREGIPYQVADSPFLNRAGAKAVLSKLRRSSRNDVRDAVEEIVIGLGYNEGAEAEAEGYEATRLADLGRLLLLARQFSGEGGVAGFLSHLTARFTDESNAGGINLLTYHRAKGKEYEAVFLPRLEERELPFALAKSPHALAEERRLLYVGLTRAKRHLFMLMAWHRPGERPSKKERSQFLREILKENTSAATQAPPPATKPRKPKELLTGADGELLVALKEWRTVKVKEIQVPAYIIFWDATLEEIAKTRPASIDQFRRVKGVGPAKAESFGEDVVSLVKAFSQR